MGNELETAVKFYKEKEQTASGGLHGLIKQIVFLHYLGASLKLIHEYVGTMGYKGTYASFTSWTRRNVDFNALSNIYRDEFEAKDPRRKNQLKNNPIPKTEKSVLKTEDLKHENQINKEVKQSHNSNQEKIEKMKASMEKLLGGETFDDQFAALNNEKNPANKKGQD